MTDLRQIAQTAVADGVVPGLVVVAGRRGIIRVSEAFGARQTVPDFAPATLQTHYDLASLTKAVVTSLLVAAAVESGHWRLDDAFARHSPYWAGGDRSGVTVRQLLAHASGLPAHRPFFAQLTQPGTPAARDQLLRRAGGEPLAYAPGTRSLYSDLGFILLGDALEQTFAHPLDQLARERLFLPLGIADLAFRPAAKGDGGGGVPPRTPWVPEIAPTEQCSVRHRLVAGEVHDLNAWAMGGVAGHAGLFGTAPALATLAMALCDLWAGRLSPLPFLPTTLHTLWTPAGIPGSSWRLGWDGPAAVHSLAGDRISRAAVGHLGFTGCSLWIDPAAAEFVIVLSNRIHPLCQDDPRFRRLRPALNDAALSI